MVNNPRHLTNQHLNDRFESPFALLAEAIAIGRDAARHGVVFDSEPGVLNQAYQVLCQIAKSNYKKP
jgi:hypothetical protein